MCVFCFCEYCGRRRERSRTRTAEYREGGLEETPRERKYSKYIVCIVRIICE